MPQTDLKKAEKNAKKIGVTVKESKEKNKKLDVFKYGKKEAAIGEKRYSDFLQHGDDERKNRYKN